jgi:enoyl-CoA hydratase/carnithine racemase
MYKGSPVPNRIQVRKQGRVVIAGLDTGPDALLDAPTVEELSQLVARASADPGTGAVVLHGTHPTRFLSHYDVGELLRLATAIGHRAPLPEHLNPLHRTLIAMEQSDVAFIAALDGSALGGGCELALACDFRVMAEGPFVIGLPEILLQLLPGAGGTHRLTRLIGHGKALELLLDRCWISGEEALAVGLVDELVPLDQVVDEATVRARRLATRSKAALGAIKRAAALAQNSAPEASLLAEQSMLFERLGDPATVTTLQRYADRTQAAGELPFFDSRLRELLRTEGASALDAMAQESSV